jgi:hypothetical protein
MACTGQHSCQDLLGFVDGTKPRPPKFSPNSQGKDSNITLNPEFQTLVNSLDLPEKLSLKHVLYFPIMLLHV